MILVIDPGGNYPEISCFNKLAGFSSVPLLYAIPALFPFDFTPFKENENLKGIILLGAGFTVDSDINWLTALRQFLEESIEKEIPFLGICFGHQLLAHIFGIGVKFIKPIAENYKKRGIEKISICMEGQTIFNGLEKEFYAVASHREEVDDLNDNFLLLASAPYSKNQVIKLKGKECYGFQTHIEAEEEFLKKAEIPYEKGGKQHLLQQKHSEILLRNFFQICYGGRYEQRS
ncbi:type 1 glutamine amidotransferase [Candidatus Riflebacteria bacterium]